MSADSLVKQLIEAGVHFGHMASSWNPKMKPYIFGKKNGIHIIDVRQTVKGLILAKRFLTRVVANGKDVLFVGTKRQAAPAIEQRAAEVNMPYVTERWLGGTLTNFRTIRSRLKRLEELEALFKSEEWHSYSKKMASQLTREHKKIYRNLHGARNLNALPGALVVVDVKKEVNALKEAQKLGIPAVCIIDTDSDPDMVSIPIPGNDDAMRAIDLIVGELCAAITEGKTARAQMEKDRKSARAAEESGESTRRRSKRAMFKAEEESAPGDEEGGVATEVATEPTAEETIPESPTEATEATQTPGTELNIEETTKDPASESETPS